MKNIITLASLLFVSIALSASTVNIINTVETDPLTLSIVYNNNSEQVLNDENSTFDITYTDSYLNNTSTKTTENFYLKASGNIPVEQGIELEITCDQFVKYIDDVASTESGIYPFVLYTYDDNSNANALSNNTNSAHSFTIDDIVAPTNTILNNTALGSFKLSWEGDSSLFAGTYISEVTFNISAE